MMKRWLMFLIVFILFAPGLTQAQPVKDGYGKTTLSDGSVYEGQFKDGKFDGKGQLDFADQRQYTGEFKNGLFDGNGVLTYADGSKYEGEFKEGRLSGQGVITYSDSTQYKGQFKDGDIDNSVTDNSVTDNSVVVNSSDGKQGIKGIDIGVIIIGNKKVRKGIAYVG